MDIIKELKNRGIESKILKNNDIEISYNNKTIIFKFDDLNQLFLNTFINQIEFQTKQ